MSNISVKFIGKEHSVPQDVLTYIELLDFTDNVQKQLANAFVRKLKIEIQKNNSGLLGNEDLAEEIEQQVGKFIAKLCDHGIFTRTIGDYLNNNKGYQYVSDVNKAALEKFKSLLMQRLDSLQEGYTDAVQRAESHVTGMGFSIWSGSFVNHAIYAAMQASTINKQEKEASAAYQREINELCTKLESDYDRETSQYINNEYIPNMEAAFTVLAYELLDRYVVDLIENGKFNKTALDFVNIGRSNDLLKNLTLSNNKQAILENAFAACPYNVAVYMQAMKHELLDYDSFQTAKVFKQDHHILSFFRENWGEASFPTKFNINYHCINVWASLTGKSSADLLRGLTEQYATGIVKAYSRVADIMADKSACRKIIGELREDAILSGASICVGKAREYVEPIVHISTWEQLTEKCGHTDLLSRIQKCFLSVEELQSKKDFDSSVTEQLVAIFEDARKELAEQIEARRAEEERQRLEREKQKAEQARIQAEKKAKRTAAVKKGAKRTLIVIGVIVAVCIALVIAGIIFLFATDKPIDNDFSERTEYSLHSLTYFAPENWEEDFEFNRSNENTQIYARYDNWGNFVCMMGVVYHGETQQISIEDVVSDYTSEYKDATTKSRQIGEQEFTVISYVRTDDYNGCNVYVTESESSLFEIYFRSVPESTNPAIFDEIVGAFAFDDYVNPKEEEYNEAVSLMSAKKYDEAISIFTELGGYKDSVAKVAECESAIIESNYGEASRLMAAGDYEEALVIFDLLGNYKNSTELSQKCTLLICDIGDTITFGTYEQDNNFSNGTEAIEWIVLDRDGDKALVISKYCIEWLPFHNTVAKIDWKNCSIRSWLNNTFLSEAFTNQEKSSIISTQNSNPDFCDDGEDERYALGTTTDRVFLLSSGEADRYFASDSDRQTVGTEYACDKANSDSWFIVNSASHFWWLRSANNIEVAGFVSDGELGYGQDVDRYMGIRPAMWIEISE